MLECPGYIGSYKICMLVQTFYKLRFEHVNLALSFIKVEIKMTTILRFFLSHDFVLRTEPTLEFSYLRGSSYILKSWQYKDICQWLYYMKPMIVMLLNKVSAG